MKNFIIYSLRDIKAIKTVILKTEFEKDEITALQRVGKSQREISKVLRCSKTVICNYLKIPNRYGTRKLIGRSEKLSPQLKRIVREVKEKLRLHQKY